MDPFARGPDWTKINPIAGSLFHEKTHSERSVGSIPTTRTTFNLKVNRRPKSSNLTRLARHSLVNSSITFSMRNLRPLWVRSSTKS